MSSLLPFFEHLRFDLLSYKVYYGVGGRNRKCLYIDGKKLLR